MTTAASHNLLSISDARPCQGVSCPVSFLSLIPWVTGIGAVGGVAILVLALCRFVSLARVRYTAGQPIWERRRVAWAGLALAAAAAAVFGMWQVVEWGSTWDAAATCAVGDTVGRTCGDDAHALALMLRAVTVMFGVLAASAVLLIFDPPGHGSAELAGRTPTSR